MSSTAMYAGSFDPMTKGHIDILCQAARVFDRIIVSIGVNPNKTRMFSIDATKHLIETSVGMRPELAGRVTVDHFNCALVDNAACHSVNAIVKGLRQVSDFNDEFVQHGVNTRLTDIPIIYFICHQEFLHVSSSTAKELVRMKKPADWLVDPHVESALWEAIHE